MTRILRYQEIAQALGTLDLVAVMERAFAGYSAGEYVIPPVGELIFDNPPGDAHIKYGHRKGDAHFVIKVAAGFYENPALGLPSSSGLNLVFSASTGTIEAILLDDGYLTNARTAATGAVAAKWLAPSDVERIGICGTGVQARMQLQHLRHVTPCKTVALWGRNPERAAALAKLLSSEGYEIDIAADPAALAASCDLIVTATASHEPLLQAADVRPGTHITAMGADTPGKNELAPSLLARADLLVVDSIGQCRERGELAHLQDAEEGQPPVRELGEIIASGGSGRETPDQVTICDLTGVAIQDIEISKAVLAAVE